VLPILNLIWDAAKDLFHETSTLSEGLKNILSLGVIFPEIYPCGGWTITVCPIRKEETVNKKKTNILVVVKPIIFILYSLDSENIYFIKELTEKIELESITT